MNTKPQSHRATSSDGNTELIIYAVILFCSSAIFALLLRHNIGRPISLWAEQLSYGSAGVSYWVPWISYLASLAHWTVPVFAWALIIFRIRFFESWIPVAILGCVALIGMMSGTGVLTLSGRLIALSAIATIGAATRYQTLARSKSDLVASSRINYTPTPRVGSVSNNWSFGHFCSIPLMVIAWIAGGVLCQDLAAFRSAASYNSIYNKLNANIGLLPEWNTGVRTLLVLTFMLWFVHSVFEYFQLRQGKGSVAAMHLRSVIWKWNGWEQRTISKQLQKTARANKQHQGE